MTLNDVMQVIDLYEKAQNDGNEWFRVDSIRKAVSQFAADIEVDSWKLQPNCATPAQP